MIFPIYHSERTSLKKSFIEGLNHPAAKPGRVGDLALAWEAGQADIILEGDALLMDGGLISAILVSLFSDARAPEESGLSKSDPRGWWPDSVGDRHGSLLWLLQREKITAETLAKAKVWTATALAWLVEEGIAERVEVEVERQELDRVAIGVKLYRSDGRRWNHLWDSLEEALLETGRVTLQVTQGI